MQNLANQWLISLSKFWYFEYITYRTMAPSPFLMGPLMNRTVEYDTEEIQNLIRCSTYLPGMFCLLQPNTRKRKIFLLLVLG
jgi:hypothetical protein